MSDKVTILLSTYNGEKFISAQIDSLLSQTHKEFIIYIRDDGSTDSTIEIIKIKTLSDPRVKLIEDTLGNLGPCLSFMALLSKIETEFFLFCDQDDIWLPDKIEASLNKIDSTYNNNEPYLSFTDLAVVDENLGLIDKSFNKRQRLDLKGCTTFEGALMQNTVTGCTLLGNRALAEKALDGLKKAQAEKIIMHDWWLAIVAIKFGRCIYLPHSKILYRQHGNNCLGSSGSGIKKAISLLISGKYKKKTNNYITSVSAQAEQFLTAYNTEISDQEREALKLTISLGRERTPASFLRCLSKKIKMSTTDRNLAIMGVLLLPKSPRNPSS